jgi:hypothetical protein
MTGKSSTAGNFGSRLQEEVQRTVVCGTTTVKYYHYNCNIFLEWRNCVVGLFDIEFSNTILLLINLSKRHFCRCETSILAALLSCDLPTDSIYIYIYVYKNLDRCCPVVSNLSNAEVRVVLHRLRAALLSCL